MVQKDYLLPGHPTASWDPFGLAPLFNQYYGIRLNKWLSVRNLKLVFAFPYLLQDPIVCRVRFNPACVFSALRLNASISRSINRETTTEAAI